MNTKAARSRFGVLMALLMLMAACGGGTDVATGNSPIDLTQDNALDSQQGSDQTDVPTPVPDQGTDDPTPVPEDPTPVPEDPTPEPVAEERTIEDVQASTVKIAVTGNYVNVGESSGLGEWSGTGFIINDEGHAVTNNHVVNGAAVLRVTVPGVEGEVNARVLGVAECSDLAVIDLEGSGYQALEFRTEPVNPGLSVFSAGYPGLGDSIEDRDYTVTGGVVSNTTGSGETYHASVETVIEHDAKIRGGNSGGPLVDEQARVVGINYFGGDVDDFNLAIAAQEAMGIIEQLQVGDVESIGVAGEAFFNDDLSGVWVGSVEPGSSADRAGVEPGDVITQLNGLPVGFDGTMADYCDVLRSNGPNDVIDIEVIRFTTEQVLVGQLNGASLVEEFSFAAEVADDMDMNDGSVNSGYELVTSDDGNVLVEVPIEWADRNGAPEPTFGPSIYAAPDLAAFNDSWVEPGIIVEVNYDLGPADHAAVLGGWFTPPPECVTEGAQGFRTTDEYYSGLWQFYTCGDAGEILALAASPVDPANGTFVVRMWVQAQTAADIQAADQALGTFDAVNQG